MTKPVPKFKPGFRFSLMDALILLSGGVASFLLHGSSPWVSMLIGTVVLHFFLFCNVFRISRAPELIWAAMFMIAASFTILTGKPGWPLTSGGAIALAAFLIALETRRASYHGIFWKHWNPGLPEWWENRRRNVRNV